MFHGWWERQASRLPLCSGRSHLELCPPLCRTNLGDMVLLQQSALTASFQGTGLPPLPFGEHVISSFPPAEQPSRNMAFASIISGCPPESDGDIGSISLQWSHADYQAVMLLQIEKPKLGSPLHPGWVICRGAHHPYQQSCQHGRGSLG